VTRRFPSCARCSTIGRAGAARGAARDRAGRHHEAYQLLEQALKSGAAAHARRDHAGARRVPRREVRAAVPPHPGEHRLQGRNEGIYTQTIESLGKVASTIARSATLKDILYRGEWWARGRTARIRTAAARALRSMGTPERRSRARRSRDRGPGAVRKIAGRAWPNRAPRRAEQLARGHQVMDQVSRLRVADDLVRKLAAALRAGQLYAPSTRSCSAPSTRSTRP
jgi:hypothetical protein